MKITIVNRYYYPDESATSRMATSLASDLARRGFDVHVITSRHLHNDTTQTLPASDRVGGVEVHRVWATGFGRHRLLSRALDYASFHLGALWRLLRHQARDDICITCSDPPLISVSTLVPVLLRGSRQVNWMFDLFPEVALDLDLIGRRSITGRILLRLRDWSLRRSALNVAPMHAMKRHLHAHGIESPPIAVIENWSDGDAIYPLAPGSAALRDEWGLTGKTVFGYSGNLGRAHEFATLIDAAERLKHRTDIVFLFVGGGYRRDWVAREAERRGLTNVLMKPLQPRDRLNEALAVPDVHIVSQLPAMEPYVIPSKFYGIAAAGRPALFIGSPDSEIAGHIRSGACGASVSIGDVDGLESAILALAADAEARSAMGANARLLFDAQFTEARGVGQWLEELARLDISDVPAEPRPARSPLAS